MKTRTLIPLAAMIVGLVTSPASAVQLNLSCGTAANALLSGSETLQGTVVGITIGATAKLADLLCFVGDRKCSCMQNSTESDHPRSSQWTDEIGSVLANCAAFNPGRSPSGVAQEAALNVCN